MEFPSSFKNQLPNCHFEHRQGWCVVVVGLLIIIIMLVNFLPFFLILINICQEPFYRWFFCVFFHCCCSILSQCTSKATKKWEGFKNCDALYGPKNIFFFNLLLPEKSVDWISIYLHQSYTFAVPYLKYRVSLNVWEQFPKVWNIWCKRTDS